MQIRVRSRFDHVALLLLYQAYSDVWEWKSYKWGPFTFKRRVPKQGPEDILRDERIHMMALDPHADPIPLEDADGNPLEPDDTEQGATHDRDQYNAVGGPAAAGPKKKMTVAERFSKMFEAEEVLHSSFCPPFCPLVLCFLLLWT